MGSCLYFLTINLNMGGQSGIDLPTVINKVKTLLSGYSSVAKCIHMYKVTGESRIIVVYDVSNVIGLERIVSGLARLDNIDITCKPVIPYDRFGSMLQVEEDLTKPSTNCIADAKQLFWLEFTVEYPGKSTDELLDTWRREAVFALGARNSGACELYKVVAERKVHLFIVTDPEDLDKLSFNLPVIKENGSGVTISSHALQSLDDYCNKIHSDIIQCTEEVV